MIESYKIISGLEDLNSSHFFTRSKMNNLRGHSSNLYKKHFRKIVQKECFTRRVINQLNGLPVEVVIEKNV